MRKGLARHVAASLTNHHCWDCWAVHESGSFDELHLVLLLWHEHQQSRKRRVRQH